MPASAAAVSGKVLTAVPSEIGRSASGVASGASALLVVPDNGAEVIMLSGIC